MYNSHFLSKTPVKIREYKTKAKDRYYNQHFQLNKNNLKETWRLIRSVIIRKAKGQSNSPSRIIRNNKVHTSELELANQFNQLLLTNINY